MYRQTTRITEHQMIEAVRQAGYVRAELHFSAGGDEGGATSATFYLADGTTRSADADPWPMIPNPKAKPSPSAPRGAYSRERQAWVDPFGEPVEIKRPLTDDEKLAELLAPLANVPYGGYGGEGYISGKFVVDVAARSIEENSHREVSHYNDEGYDLYNDEG